MISSGTQLTISSGKASTGSGGSTSSSSPTSKSSRIRIAVRVRPLSEPEVDQGHNSVVERINDNGVRVWDPMAMQAGLIRGDVNATGSCWIRDFYFDHCLWSLSEDDENFADQSVRSIQISKFPLFYIFVLLLYNESCGLLYDSLFSTLSAVPW